jgi:phage recombination protein Bet
MATTNSATELATVSDRADLKWTRERIELFKALLLGDKVSDAEMAMAIEICNRLGLDPFARQIYFIPRQSKLGDNWVTKLVPQVSIDGFRLVAERTGHYAGQLGPFWTADGKDWTDCWLSDKPPAAAKVGVLRPDFKEPLWAVARFSSYVQIGKDGKATKFWANMPELMISKVAEALALRRAFPNELSGVYTSEEMDQADNIPPTMQVTQTAAFVRPTNGLKPGETLDTTTGEVIDYGNPLVQTDEWVRACTDTGLSHEEAYELSEVVRSRKKLPHGEPFKADAFKDMLARLKTTDAGRPAKLEELRAVIKTHKDTAAKAVAS